MHLCLLNEVRLFEIRKGWPTAKRVADWLVEEDYLKAVETVLWPTIPLVENMDYSLEKFSCLELENVNPVVQNLSKSKKNVDSRMQKNFVEWHLIAMC